MICYCKICKALKNIVKTIIDQKDIQTHHLECGHKRAYQLVTSTEDYK